MTTNIQSLETERQLLEDQLEVIQIIQGDEVHTEACRNMIGLRLKNDCDLEAEKNKQNKLNRTLLTVKKVLNSLNKSQSPVLVHNLTPPPTSETSPKSTPPTTPPTLTTPTTPPTSSIVHRQVPIHILLHKNTLTNLIYAPSLTRFPTQFNSRALRYSRPPPV